MVRQKVKRAAERFEVVSWIAIVIVVVAAVWPYLTTWLGKLEGKHNPPFSEVTFDIREDGPTSSLVGGSFHLDRPECDFLEIKWQAVGYGRKARATVEFLEGTKARPEGYNDFGPWRVSISKARLEASSVANVYHQCPWRLWPVITQFYP